MTQKAWSKVLTSHSQSNLGGLLIEMRDLNRRYQPIGLNSLTIQAKVTVTC